MITIKQFLVLFVLCLTPFVFLSFRTELIGFDSYYFLNHVCNGLKTEWWSTSLLTPTLLDFIPCNPLIINSILFFSLLFSTVGVAQTGNLIHEKYGWMAGFFLFMSSKWFQGFLAFEDDPIAYPFLFFSLYFLVKGMIKKNSKDKLISLLLVGLACLIWKGAILYFIVYGLSYIVSTIISMPILLLKGKEIISNLIPFNNVMENQAIIGISYTGTLFLGLILAPFFLPLILMPSFVFWTAILVFNAKFIIHALPFYSITVMLLYSRLKEKRNEFIKWIPILLIALVFAVWLPSSYNTINQYPQPEQFNLIEKGIQLSQETGKPLKNEWSAGYWIEWLGGKPTAKGGYGEEQDYNKSIVISMNEQLNEGLDRECLKVMESMKLKLYDCN